MNNRWRKRVRIHKQITRHEEIKKQIEKQYMSIRVACDLIINHYNKNPYMMAKIITNK